MPTGELREDYNRSGGACYQPAPNIPTFEFVNFPPTGGVFDNVCYGSEHFAPVGQYCIGSGIVSMVADPHVVSLRQPAQDIVEKREGLGQAGKSWALSVGALRAPGSR